MRQNAFQRRAMLMVSLISLSACTEALPSGIDGSGSSASFASAASNKKWWDGLTTDQQKQTILNRARQDLNKRGGQCKAWVQAVVASATKNVVAIPQNNSNKLSEWKLSASDPYVRKVADQSNGSIRTRVTNADMIQATHTGKPKNPHTMMVESWDASGMMILDSNWKNDEVVRRHYMTYEQFHKQFDRWTLYRATKSAPAGPTRIA